jgi:valyl-tRNA synthetase
LGRLGEEFIPHATPFENKPKSLSEKWILHRLNSAALEVTSAIEAREFSIAAGTLYRYWFTQLCDTFIEYSKPILMPDVPEAELKSAQQTLYTAIEGRLLLMHPIMPFLTEHLWQKLPRRKGDTTESIMIARYPEFEKSWHAPQAALEYEFIMDISTGIRSLLSRYKLKEPGDVVIQTYSDSAFKIVSAERTSIKSLGGKCLGEIEITVPSTDALPPRGCALQSISTEAAVYLKMLDRIDLEDELNKLTKSLSEAKAKVEKTQRIISGKGWERASEETKRKERAKLADAESEVRRMEEALKDLERLRLEAYTQLGN